MKECIACLKEKPLASGTKLCIECHKVWKSLHHFPNQGEGTKNRMKAKVGQYAFFKIAVLESCQIEAKKRSASASGASLVGTT